MLCYELDHRVASSTSLCSSFSGVHDTYLVVIMPTVNKRNSKLTEVINLSCSIQKDTLLIRTAS